MRRLARLAALSLVLATPAVAQEPLDGWFIALRSCEAYQSKNALTNPGEVTVEPMRAYDMIGINKTGGDWYQVRIPGAPVANARWVALSCGIHAVAAGPAPAPAPTGPFEPPEGSESTDNLLALSWQPAFCETRPAKTECRQLNDGLLPITETRLSLHGLWPQPNGTFHCGVPDEIRRLDKPDTWGQLPAPILDADLAERLDVAMPGRASFLDRHEWIKHGTCFFGDGQGQEYFADSLTVLDAVNDSEIAALLARHVGAELEVADLRATFDRVFGTGAGDRVQVHCTGDGARVLIQEIKVPLKGEIAEGGDIGALIRAADPQAMGCPRGVVDPTGLQ